jgi:hypothetical protein
MANRKEFRHHPDGIIYINDISIPLEEFVKENPDYELPQDYTGREYVQGEYHRLYNFRDETFLDKKWKEGDTYIKDYTKYKNKKKELEEKALAEVEAEHEKEREINEQEKIVKNKAIDEKVENERIEREEEMEKKREEERKLFEKGKKLREEENV